MLHALTSFTQNVKKLSDGGTMHKLYIILFSITLSILTACSGGGSRTKDDKNKDGRIEALTGADEIFKEVADAIMQQNLDKIKELYLPQIANGKTIKYKASCFNPKFANSVYYNLTLPQIAATFAVNENNSDPNNSIFKYILENTEGGRYVHYSCDNSKYPIHILAAYGFHNAMEILVKYITNPPITTPPIQFDKDATLRIEQFPNPDIFKEIGEYSKHNFNFTKFSQDYYQKVGINLQGDYVRRSPLYTAMYYGHYDIVDLLINKDYMNCFDWEVMAQVAIDKGFSDRITPKCKPQ